MIAGDNEYKRAPDLVENSFKCPMLLTFKVVKIFLVKYS